MPHCRRVPCTRNAKVMQQRLTNRGERAEFPSGLIACTTSAGWVHSVRYYRACEVNGDVHSPNTVAEADCHPYIHAKFAKRKRRKDVGREGMRACASVEEVGWKKNVQ